MKLLISIGRQATSRRLVEAFGIYFHPDFQGLPMRSMEIYFVLAEIPLHDIIAPDQSSQ